ncbi:MAG: hypothetical protein IJF43_06105 [Firmicutes bacterium]|nr:hypothetical protein [Bacillota bacterium]
MARMDFSQEFFDRMEELDQHRVKMLVAPLGYGKSVAVKLWFSMILKSVPIHLIPEGNSGEDFWQGFCKALEEFYPELSLVLKKTNFPRTEQEFGYCTDFMQRAFDEKGYPCCIVIDDLHFFQDAEVLPLIQYWIDHLSEKVSFMLVSERKPNLIAEDTDLLTAEDFELPHRELLNDVKGKLWDPLDDRQKMFLAANSIAESFTEEQALFIWDANDGEILMEELICQGSFVLSKYGEYRIHDLLRQYSEGHFHQISVNMQRKFFERLGQWYRDHGEMMLALLSFYQCGCWEELLLVLAKDGGKCITNDYSSLASRWSKECPQGLLMQNPEAVIALMYACYRFRQGMEMFRLRRVLNEILEDGNLEESRKQQCLAEAEMLYGLADFNDIVTMKTHYVAASEASERCEMVNTDGYWASASPTVLGLYHSAAGTLDAELAAMEEAMTAYTKVTDGHGSGGALLMKAEAFYLRGDVAEAKKQVAEALKQAMEHRQFDLILAAEFLQMRILLWEKKEKEALDKLEELAALLKKEGQIGLMAALDVCRGWIYSFTGKADEVPEWLLGDRALFSVPYSAAPFFQTTINQILIGQKNWLRIVGRKNEFAKLFEYNHALLNSIYLHVQLIGGFDDFQRSDNALVELNIALDMAAPDGIVMPFIENLEHIRPYLEERKDDAIYGEFIQKILS